MPEFLPVSTLLLDFLPSTIVGLSAICFGIVLFAFDRDSTINRLMAASLALMGLAIGFGTPLSFMWPDGNVPFRVRFYVIGFWAVPFVAIEYVIRIARDNLSTGVRAVERHVRLVRAVAWVGLILNEVWLAEFLNDYLFSVAEPGALSRPGFWLFAVVNLAGTAAFVLACSALAVHAVAPAWRSLAVALAIATVFFGFSVILPVGYSALANLAGQIAMMIGLTRHHMLRGAVG